MSQALRTREIFKLKQKCGTIHRVGTPAPNQPGRFWDAYGKDLFKKETDMKLFLGKRVQWTLAKTATSPAAGKQAIDRV